MRVLIALATVLLLVAPACAAPVLERHVLSTRNGVVISELFYRVDNLRIEARLFVPGRPGPMPGVVYAHDGNDGLSRSSVTRCVELASHGYVVLAPSYRGEDRSEGSVEVADGEVRDVLGAAGVLSQMSEVDPQRLAAIGTSHGALIVMLAAERSQVFKAVIEGYGVMDIVEWWHYLKAAHFSTDDPLSRRIYGRGPQDKPEAFARREVVPHVDQLQAAVMIVQGGADRTVPPSQASALEQAMHKAGKTCEVVRYPTEPHGFLIYPGDPVSNQHRDEAWSKIRAFLERHLSR